jgi:hypothetical protein
MKRLSAVFAFAALAAGTVALAQQTPQQQPPASQQTTPAQADKTALMKDCLAKVQAANPQASKEDVTAYCDKKVQEYTSQQKQ